MGVEQRSYEIRAETHRRLLYIRNRGSLTAETARDFVAEARKCILELSSSGQSWAMLVDMSDSPVQSQDVTLIVAEMIAEARSSGLHRAAVVGAGALKSLQAKRMRSGVQGADFETVADAIAWLERERLGRT